MSRISRREFAAAAAALSSGVVPMRAPGAPEEQRTKVVIVTCAGVIDKSRPLDRAALVSMFEAGMTALSGRRDVVQAWRAFIRPGDQVALADAGTWLMNVPEVLAEAARGITLASPKSVKVTYCARDEQHRDWIGQMRAAMDFVHVPAETLDGTIYAIPSSFGSQPFTSLVMTPTLKSHSVAGVSGVVKHFATMSKVGPSPHHPNAMETAGSVIVPEFGHMSKLIIVDALRWGEITKGPSYYQKSLIFGTDPVATDMVALDLFLEHRKPYAGLPPERHRILADTRYHAGISDRSRIDIVRLNV